jgi:hypothetical protein
MTIGAGAVTSRAPAQVWRSWSLESLAARAWVSTIGDIE